MRIGGLDRQLDLFAGADRTLGVGLPLRRERDLQLPLDAERTGRLMESSRRNRLFAGLQPGRFLPCPWSLAPSPVFPSVITATDRSKFGASFADIGIVNLFAPVSSCTSL